MTKSVNEGSMLVAQALEKLKYYVEMESSIGNNCDEIKDSIALLELALEKLVADIS